jgi:hypothetical protein
MLARARTLTTDADHNPMHRGKHRKSSDIRQQDRTGRGLTNEKKYPYVVELAVTGEGLDIALSRRIMNFHKSRHIHPRHGRTIIKQEQIYYRWCFPDLAAAHDFVEQFGGGFYKP